MLAKSLQSLGFSVALLAAVLMPSSAQATGQGSVTAVINNVAGSAYFSIHANSVGWPAGSSIHVHYNVYVGGSSTGPWTQVGSDTNTCTGTTHCSTSTATGTCTDGWYRLVAHAQGPGGDAENDPDIKIKHIHGTISGRVPASCSNIFIPI